MNDIDEIPPKCHDCPYWEVCEYPYVCYDMRKAEMIASLDNAASKITAGELLEKFPILKKLKPNPNHYPIVTKWNKKYVLGYLYPDFVKYMYEKIEKRIERRIKLEGMTIDFFDPKRRECGLFRY